MKTSTKNFELNYTPRLISLIDTVNKLYKKYGELTTKEYDAVSKAKFYLSSDNTTMTVGGCMKIAKLALSLQVKYDFFYTTLIQCMVTNLERDLTFIAENN